MRVWPASRLAGAWVLRGRGERSHIRIWARCEPSKKAPQPRRDAGGDPDERPKPFYKLEAVFCERQVEPPPPPAEPAPLESPIVPLAGEELGWALAPLDALAAELGVTVTTLNLPAGLDGFYQATQRTIAISSDLTSDNARAATRVRELLERDQLDVTATPACCRAPQTSCAPHGPSAQRATARLAPRAATGDAQRRPRRLARSACCARGLLGAIQSRARRNNARRGGRARRLIARRLQNRPTSPPGAAVARGLREVACRERRIAPAAIRSGVVRASPSSRVCG